MKIKNGNSVTDFHHYNSRTMITINQEKEILILKDSLKLHPKNCQKVIYFKGK